MLYTRQQLVLLLLLLAAAGVGLAVREWRAAYPELAERLEQLDRHVETPPPAEPAARSRPRDLPLESATPGHRLDLNRATPDELTRLPGVGPGLAGRIVQARETAGRFGSIDELRRVKGLGAGRLERLRPLLTVAD
jgi:competence ComEA-like helix-hairpin-helix protein